MIIKSYNNFIKSSNKPRNINIETEFETDNYLIQTLKRTIKFQNDKKLPKYEQSLQDLLLLIYQKIKFRNNPYLQLIHEENEDFLKQYKHLSNIFEDQTEQVLKDLIIKYIQRGYHIPKFSYKNNIFKVNALIEENSEKLRLMLLEDLKNKNNIIGPKTLKFLTKLFYLVKILSTEDQNAIKKYSKLLNKKDHLKEKESIEELQKEIKVLIDLTKDLKLNKIGYSKAKRKSSYLSNIPYPANFKIVNSKNENKDDVAQSNNNNNGILSTEESSSGINIRERNHFSFLSMRIKKYGQSNKLISSLYSKNKIVPFENIKNNTENNKDNDKSNSSKKKAKPLINLKKKSWFSKERNEKIKTEYQNEKVEGNSSPTRKNTFSDLGKYMTQAKGNKFYQSQKNNNYFLGLKKNSDNVKGYNFLSQKENNKFLGHSFDNTKKIYIKRKSKKKNTFSRNEKNQSELKQIKKGKTEGLEEKKTNLLWKAYRVIKSGKYEKVESFMRKYLKEIKEVDSTEGEKIMDYYNYKNLRNNLFELNVKINDDKTSKKIEKIYSNIHILKRVTPALITTKEKEKNIDRLEKIYTSGVNKYI